MKKSRGLYEKIGDTVWIHCEGMTYSISLKTQETGGRAARSSAGAESGTLKSPMPGKILKVNFKPGESVGAGQTVVVIEAMKMEYALKSPFKGKVKAVLKKAGDSVALDETLADLEEDRP